MNQFSKYLLTKLRFSSTLLLSRSFSSHRALRVRLSTSSSITLGELLQRSFSCLKINNGRYHYQLFRDQFSSIHDVLPILGISRLIHNVLFLIFLSSSFAQRGWALSSSDDVILIGCFSLFISHTLPVRIKSIQNYLLFTK